MGLGKTIQKMFSRTSFYSQTQSDNWQGNYSQLEENKRGFSVYFTSDIVGASARTKEGKLINAPVEQPYFIMTPETRVRAVQACAPVFGVITSRMNRIAARELTVISDREQEDLIVDRLRDIKNIINEFAKVNDPSYIIASIKLKTFLQAKLYDLTPDMNNFEQSLLRWSKYNKSQSKIESDRIKNWLMEPNQNDNWEVFVKQWVFDMMTHGSASIMKEAMNGKVENIYTLAGGTVFPIRDKYVTGITGYVQAISLEEPQLFFKNELVHSIYLPISSRACGLVPIEALVNKIIETLLFDKLMASQADGTKLPEKMIIVTENSPFGAMDNSLKISINKNEQKRLEKKLNTPLKGGVMTFSGNTATVVDLTRENTMQIQMQRQKDIREEVALVFNMSNMEINLTGSENVSGRSTSESQSEIEQGKGTLPIMVQLETAINKEILPFRYGTGYTVQFHTEENEKEEFEKLRLKMATGLYAINELRTKDLNLNPFPGEEYNVPPGTGQQTPDGSTINPFNMKAI